MANNFNEKIKTNLNKSVAKKIKNNLNKSVAHWTR